MPFYRYARPKVFGPGRPQPCDTDGKRRIMARARLLMEKTTKGRPWGLVTPKMLAVLEALVWRFHNARTGLCFPSIKTLAEAARCSPTTVQEALRRLEELGLISWVHRLKRVTDNLGRTRPVRASNGYQLHPPAIDVRDAPPAWPATNASSRLGTRIQEKSYSWERRQKPPQRPERSDDFSDFVIEVAPVKTISATLMATAAFRVAHGG